jgi:excisionase family DNA binding protein
MASESNRHSVRVTLPSEDQEFLTVQETARILKLNPQTVRNWIGRGVLPAVRIGRMVRIRCVDFEQFLDNSRVQPKTWSVPEEGGRAQH